MLSYVRLSVVVQQIVLQTSSLYTKENDTLTRDLAKVVGDDVNNTSLLVF